uniref:Alkaline phosphatase n=1 Tax=Bombyx mandarina TaxID=7092 RepID=B2ZZW7_BOMMA|nr:alkaline phosphatase [Bombyx mandarina]
MSTWWLVVVAAAAAAGLVRAEDRYHPERLAAGEASAATRSAAESEASFWVREAQEAIERREREGAGAKQAAGHAKNVVMFLGDGMSVPTLAAARTLLGQRRGQTGEEASLHFEQFPTLGLAKTYCVNAQVPDSSCTATAYLCGVKANQGTLGVTAAVPRHDCEASTDVTKRVQSIAEWALADGRDVGIVTTTRITHASPAGTFAKVANRNWENDNDVKQEGHDVNRCPDIAHQLIKMAPGNKFKVIFGGGRREFLPTTQVDEEGTRGLRTDGRNLIEEWQNDKESQKVSYKYLWNRQELLKLASSPPDYLLGLFEGSHLQYHLEGDESTEPTLAELTDVAIRVLSRNERGFFLFVEGGRIDHAHHDNYAHLALDETIEMDRAVKVATDALKEDESLVVVTADHTHVMSFNGYSPRGTDVLGTVRSLDSNRMPFMVLSYTNGPGARIQQNGVRPDVTTDANFGALRWRTHTDVPLDSETHGGDDVTVFAWGVHHWMFSGLYEQTHVPHRMAWAACMGPGRHVCVSAATVPTAALLSLLLAVFITLRHQCFL